MRLPPRSQLFLQLPRQEAPRGPPRAFILGAPGLNQTAPPSFFLRRAPPCRTLARVKEHGRALPDVWFTGVGPLRAPEGYSNRDDQHQPPDERTLKLGKTLRVLQSRLPTLLQTPLPQEILSPQISLLLFPSTHPHLPAATGRVSYIAALWTAPMAWGRVPIVGNVRLRILSERMVPSGPSHHSSSAGSSTTTGGPSPLLPGTPTSTNNSNRKRPTYRSEKLVVRWTTVGNSGARLMEAFSRSSNKKKSVSGRQSNPLSRDSTSYEEDDEEHFTGLFEFEFDEEGRIVRHTIERAEQEGIAGEAPSTGVFGLGEWLLRRVGKAREPEPVMAMAAGFDAGWADGSQMVLRARRDMKGGT